MSSWWELNQGSFEYKELSNFVVENLTIINFEYKVFEPKKTIVGQYCYHEGEIWFSEQTMKDVLKDKKFYYVKNISVNIDGEPKLFYLANSRENMVWYNIDRPSRNLFFVIKEKYKK